MPASTVYDVDNVPVPMDLGHQATAYVRKWQRVTGMNGGLLGHYEPITFRQKTCMFINALRGEQGTSVII